MASRKPQEVEPFPDDPAQVVPIKGVDSQYIPQSYEDALAALEEAGVEVVALETNWSQAEKEALLGRPFLIFDVAFNSGDYAGEFTSVHLITEDGERYFINDGGTGVYAQLKELVATTKQTGGFLVKNGLRKSEYDYDQDDRKVVKGEELRAALEAGHKVTKGVTFYLNP